MTLRPRLLPLAPITVGAAAVGAVLGRARAVREVPRTMRTPMLWAPVAIANPTLLRVARRVYGAATQPVDGVAVGVHELPEGGSVRVHVPTSGRPEPSGALVWIHGGGTIMGTAAQDDRLCSELARDVGVVVVSVEYRLAPEHPFPAPLDDCAAALAWLHEHAVELGVDPERIAVGGASAGGLLAASLAQRATDEGLPVAFQLLVYPMLDDRTVLCTEHGGRGRFLWTPASNRFAWTSFLGRPPAEDGTGLPAYAVPARRVDLADLPPAWIGVGDLDLFHDEDLEYAARLRAAGVACDVHVEPGMYHAADVDHADSAPGTARFRASARAALRRAVGTP
ncbi:alpha/beta hydrolase [Nocardioides sp. SOB77]|uniref:Alpha/beta hydrolase n=1 Tax=Nocardioides oceani TaxID=3058369 RepID=A0ABT8FIZ4_9ACTN|nr:alpha/beta hydrolase [Nocardioides oceani]MDN4174649.1 alpha/beta hydrolase [Nocardioides oceani]